MSEIKLDGLRKLGLTEYEIRVYGALLHLGAATGGKVSEESGVPHGKTYQSLQSLVEKGFVKTVPVRPKLFKVENPREAIESYTQRQTNELAELAKVLIASVVETPKIVPSKIYERVAVMENTKHIMNYVIKQSQRAAKEMLILSRGERIPSATMRAFAVAIKRGVNVKLIVFDLDGNREDIKEFLRLGFELRYLPDYRLTFIVVDSVEAEIVIRDPKNIQERIGIVFENEALASMLRDWFNVLWQRAERVRL